MPTAWLKKKLPPTVSQTQPAGKPVTWTLPPYGLAAEAAALWQSAGTSTVAIPDGQLVPPALPSPNAMVGVEHDGRRQCSCTALIA